MSGEESVTPDSICKISPSVSNVYHHRMIIEDIEQIVKDYPNNRKLVGDDFKIPVRYSSVTCYISIYPSGRGKGGFLSVFLCCREPADENVKMKVECCIIAESGQKKNVYSSSEHEASVYVDRLYVHFIKHSDLFDASKCFLKNGNLTLAFKITCHHSDATIKSHTFAENLVDETKDTFKVMKKFHQGFMSDFIIECSDHQEVNCHSIILAAKSEVFEKMLTHDTPEKREGRVKMEGLDKEICDNILKYVYTGCLNEDLITMELYMQADKMGFLQLKDICSKNLVQHINKDNAVEILVIGDVSNDQVLKDAAVECIEENYDDKIADELKNNVDQDLWSELYNRLTTHWAFERFVIS